MDNKNIFMLIALIISSSTVFSSCDVSDYQQVKIDEMIEAVNERNAKIIDKMVEKPKTSKEAGCLDGLYGISLDHFKIDKNIKYSSGIASQINKMIQFNCQSMVDSITAKVDNWNENIDELREYIGIDLYKEGEASLNVSKDLLKLPEIKLEEWVDPMYDRVTGTIPDVDLNKILPYQEYDKAKAGLNNIKNDAKQKVKNTLKTDDLKKSFKETFYH